MVFMGVGLGVDVVTAQGADSILRAPQPVAIPTTEAYAPKAQHTRSQGMIPVFSNFHSASAISHLRPLLVYLSKIGAAWLIGTPYLRLLTPMSPNSTRFYCKPKVGVRIPLIARNSSQAFNIGLTYRLLTADDDYYWSPGGNVTLNSFESR